jgi:hypothetical protein
VKIAHIRRPKIAHSALDLIAAAGGELIDMMAL